MFLIIRLISILRTFVAFPGVDDFCFDFLTIVHVAFKFFIEQTHGLLANCIICYKLLKHKLSYSWTYAALFQK